MSRYSILAAAALVLLQAVHVIAVIVVTRINPEKSAPAGNVAMFIYGADLVSPTIAVIGVTACASHDYISANIFSCNAVPPGVGASIPVKASISQTSNQSSVSNFFSDLLQYWLLFLLPWPIFLPL